MLFYTELTPDVLTPNVLPKEECVPQRSLYIFVSLDDVRPVGGYMHLENSGYISYMWNNLVHASPKFVDKMCCVILVVLVHVYFS